MNPIWILYVVIMVALFAIGAILGRKNQEWRNLLRIVIGVGLFVIAWSVVISSDLEQWTKVGIIVFACLALWLLNLVKRLSPPR